METRGARQSDWEPARLAQRARPADRARGAPTTRPAPARPRARSGWTACPSRGRASARSAEDRRAPPPSRPPCGCTKPTRARLILCGFSRSHAPAAESCRARVVDLPAMRVERLERVCERVAVRVRERMPAPLRFRDERRAAAAASRLRVAIVEARERLQAGDVRRERELAVAERQGRERIRTPEGRVVPTDERVAIDPGGGSREAAVGRNVAVWSTRSATGRGRQDQRERQAETGAIHRLPPPLGGSARSIRRSGTSHISATDT